MLTLVLPAAAPSRKPLGFCRRTTRGIRFYLATPRLRALLSLNLAVAAPGAMVLVNSVVLVRGALGLDDNALAWAMFAFGLGSMVSAIALPRFLDSLSDRFVMLLGSTLSMIAVVSLATTVSFVGLRWHTLLFAWFVVGLGYSATLTPAGRLLRRSSGPSERTAIFAAHFALSHVCWLLAYPLAGWLMTRYGAVAALFALATLSAAATVAASRMWSRGDPQRLEHTHDNLPLEHPHLRGVRTHSHALIIDEDHPKWDSYFPPHHYAP
ncbi:MAG: MFS transporter [Myxococcota bacterium]